MLIQNDELIHWAESVSLRANSRSSKHIRHLIDTFKYTGLVADSESESSKRLQKIVKSHHSILTEDAYSQLESVSVFGIDILQCDAFPMYCEDKPAVILFDGLLQLIRFYTDLQLLMNILDERMPEHKVRVNGEDVPVALAMSLFGHVALMESIDSGHQLVDLSHMLGPVARQRSDYGYGAAVLFYVLHELGHVVSGHLDKGFVSEQVSIDVVVEEDINSNQHMELEADRFALQSIGPEVRNVIISSLVFALAPFAFLETFKGSLDKNHPLTVNRIAALADQVEFKNEPELANAVVEIVASEVRRFERLAEDRRLGGEAIQNEIRDNLSLADAYGVLRSVEKCISENGGCVDFG